MDFKKGTHHQITMERLPAEEGGNELGVTISTRSAEANREYRLEVNPQRLVFVYLLEGHARLTSGRHTTQANSGEFVCFAAEKAPVALRFISESGSKVLVLQLDPAAPLFAALTGKAAFSYGAANALSGPLARLVHHCLAAKANTGEYLTGLGATYQALKSCELAVLFLEACIQETFPDKRRNPALSVDKMRQIEQYMRSAPEQDFTLKTLAAHIGSNVTFVKTNFKKVYGQSAFALLTQIRMEKALDLLTHSPLSVEAVALEVGYRHGTHFSAAFKRYYGTLPKKIKSHR